MNISEQYTKAVDEYMHRLQFQNLSGKTISNYDTVLRRFGAFLRDFEDGDDLYAAVEAWRDTLTEHGAKPSTVCQYLTTLKIFFDKATKRSFPAAVRFAENPVDTDLFPKVVKRPYDEILTDEQVTMLYRITPPPHFANWQRNYAMMMILLNEKIRNSELLDLRLSDLDFAHHELTVQSGKGRKYRVVDMSELTEQAISRYLDGGSRPCYANEGDYLFGTTAAHVMGNSGTGRAEAERWHRGTGVWLSNVIERTVRAITGVPNVRSHDLRHVGARVCLNAGQSLEELQGQLGHSQITTTQIYSSRLLQRRRRESAKSVLAARDDAAEQLKLKNSKQEKVFTLFA